MDSEFFKENLIAILSVIVTSFSVVVASIALLLNKKISRINSYGLRGNYVVFFQKKNTIIRYLKGSSFCVKLFNSVTSETINFDYDLKIKPLIGGINRSQIFSDIEKREYIGTNRTFPVIRNHRNRNRFPKRYAHQNVVDFSSSPLYSYFSVNGKFNKDMRDYERRLARYHKYIEITDYCGNTEIWYISFSLYLSNVEEVGEWRRCDESIGFKQYKFADLNVVSPKDLLKNINAIEQFNKKLLDISGSDKDWGESERFMKVGYSQINSDLQLYEMKEYKFFLDKLRNYI